MTDLFSRLIEKTTILKSGCWMYLGGWGRGNYGHIWDSGHTRRAHIVSYELHVGPVPKDICVLHECDNPWCINPGHLFLGTAYDNIHDMIDKDRDGFKGTRNGRCLLSERDVIDVRLLLEEGTLSQQKIADRFGVSRSTVAAIKSGRNWGQQ